MRGALWAEIDLAAALWTIPGKRMKGGEVHRVPLSAAAVKLLQALPRIAKGQPGHDLVFAAPRGGPLSDATLNAVIKRMNEKHETPKWIDPEDGREAVQHGFRATFKTWGRECTHHSPAAIELALAHTIGGKVEQAYMRVDMLDKRVPLMVDWAAFVARAVPRGGTVVQMKRKAH